MIVKANTYSVNFLLIWIIWIIFTYSVFCLDCVFIDKKDHFISYSPNYYLNITCDDNVEFVLNDYFIGQGDSISRNLRLNPGSNHYKLVVYGNNDQQFMEWKILRLLSFQDVGVDSSYKKSIDEIATLINLNTIYGNIFEPDKDISPSELNFWLNSLFPIKKKYYQNLANISPNVINVSDLKSILKKITMFPSENYYDIFWQEILITNNIHQISTHLVKRKEIAYLLTQEKSIAKKINDLYDWDNYPFTKVTIPNIKSVVWPQSVFVPESPYFKVKVFVNNPELIKNIYIDPSNLGWNNSGKLLLKKENSVFIANLKVTENSQTGVVRLPILTQLYNQEYILTEAIILVYKKGN